MKALSTRWAVLKQPFQFFKYLCCASLPYTENWNQLQWINLEKFDFIVHSFFVKFHGCSVGISIM